MPLLSSDRTSNIHTFEREFDMKLFNTASFFSKGSLAILLFFSSSCLNQGKLPKVPGVDGPHLNVSDGKIILSIGLENLDAPGGASFTIPKMEYSTATLMPGQFGGTIVKVAFDPRDVESDHFKVVPPEKLPDGRDFPFTVDGSVPALALNVPKLLDTTFYASKVVFGFFIPVNLPKDVQIPYDLAFRLKINGKNVGIVSYIRENSDGEGSGVVLMLTMKQINENPDFKTLLEHSKKYQKKVF